MQQAETQVVELATNLDDASGELVGEAVATLLQTPGVLDVWTSPIAMKKDRPGIMLRLLCEADAVETTARRIIELTGTFGVRHRAWDRIVLRRTSEIVDTEFGRVGVKVGSLDGEIMVVKPEFEDVRTVAEASGVSVRQVMEAARAAAHRLLPRKDGQP